MLEKRSAGQRPAAARAPLSGGERLAPEKLAWLVLKKTCVGQAANPTS